MTSRRFARVRLTVVPVCHSNPRCHSLMSLRGRHRRRGLNVRRHRSLLGAVKQTTVPTAWTLPALQPVPLHWKDEPSGRRDDSHHRCAETFRGRRAIMRSANFVRTKKSAVVWAVGRSIVAERWQSRRAVPRRVMATDEWQYDGHALSFRLIIVITFIIAVVVCGPCGNTSASKYRSCFPLRERLRVRGCDSILPSEPIDDGSDDVIARPTSTYADVGLTFVRGQR